MAVYLGNQLIGNGLYLGNENYRDSNVFMSMSSAPPAPADNFPTALNAGLLGRWEITNASSWPGSGNTITNLATASAYSGLYALIYSSSAIDTTDGVQFNGGNSAAGITFGATGSITAGSPGLNNPIVYGTEAVTIATVCYNNSTGPADAMIFNSWTDYSDNDFFLAIGRDGVSALRTNTGYNTVSGQGAYFVSDAVKFFGSRLTPSSLNNWLGTSQYNAPGASGADFGGNKTQANNSLWTWGNNLGAGATTALNRTAPKGKWWASYIWNRLLSDGEMGDLQSYTNTYIKANS